MFFLRTRLFACVFHVASACVFGVAGSCFAVSAFGMTLPNPHNGFCSICILFRCCVFPAMFHFPSYCFHFQRHCLRFWRQRSNFSTFLLAAGSAAWQPAPSAPISEPSLICGREINAVAKPVDSPGRTPPGLRRAPPLPPLPPPHGRARRPGSLCCPLSSLPRHPVRRFSR